MTYAEMKLRAAYLATLQGWTEVAVAPDWGSLINEAWAQFSWDTECVVASATVTTVANQREYTLTSPAWKRLRSVIYDSLYVLDESSERAEYDLNPLWTTVASGTPQRYIFDRGNVLQLVPAPSAGSVAVALRGIRQGTALSSATDEPSCPAVYHEAIALLAVWKWAKGFATGEDDLLRLGRLLKEYESQASGLRQYLMNLRGRAVQRTIKHRFTPRMEL